MAINSNDWESLSWGDLATLEYGKALRGYKGSTGQYPVYGTNGQIGWYDKYLCPFAGVIVGRKGAYRGAHYSKTPFSVIDTAFYLNPKGTHCLDLKWAYFHLLDFDINKIDSGSAIPSTSREAFYAIPVRLPPLNVQQKIASILSVYDDLIENNHRRIRTLEEIAQLIYREWFVKFRFPGHEKVKMVDSPLREIPENWKVISLGKLMDIKGGAQPPKSSFIYEPDDGYIRLLQIRDYQHDKHQTYVPDSENLRKCEENDIMVARYGASVARIMWGMKGAYNVAIAKVIPKHEKIREFLRFYLLSSVFQKTLIGMSGRTAQAGFNKRDINAIQLVIPKNEKIFSAFEDFSLPLLEKSLLLKKRIGLLKETRDLLLPKLISGQLDVSELDIDIGDSAA